MFSSRTLSVSIACAPTKVYEFVRDPRNLPQWAPAFCKSVRPAGDNWTVETPQGPIGLRFAPRNALGVLDHYVSPTPDVEIYVPMRVVPNAQGSEVLFTLFRLDGVSDQAFEEDAGFVQQDLNTLKSVLEA
jgi:hypothetical protein